MLGSRRVARVALGCRHTLLLDSEGAVLAAGRNDHGQLGGGAADAADRRAARTVAGLGAEHAVQIAAGRDHSAAVTGSGFLFMWGSNGEGQCGTGRAGGDVVTATRCATGALADADRRVAFVACGTLHTVALTTDHLVVVMGNNTHGQLGTGANGRCPAPELLLLACAALDGVRIVGCAAGGSFTHLVSDDGRVFAMGFNANGNLGFGHTNNVNEPTLVDPAHFDGEPVVAMACSTSFHTLALTRKGALYACGKGGHAATGLGHTNDAVTPQRVVVGSAARARIVRIAVGNGHSCALTDAGHVLVFGAGAGAPSTLQLQDALAGTTIGALGGGCYAEHSAFLVGKPPRAPGFDEPLPLPWIRRRTLLLCLIAAKRSLAPPRHIAQAQPSLSVLLHVRDKLPEDLWRGLFQYF